jgi:hypothetical protein
MRLALICSLMLHLMVAIIGFFGLPLFRPDLPPTVAVITVDVATMADETNVPSKPKKEATTKAKPKSASNEAKPAPVAKPSLSKNPVKRPADKKQASDLPTKTPKESAPPTVTPIPNKEPQSEPPAAPRATPENTDSLVAAKPKARPSPPSTFDSVLKAVRDLEHESPATEEQGAPKDDESGKSFDSQIADALSQSNEKTYNPDRPVTMSEIDLVRRQIERCWSLPAGAKDAEDMVVSIRVEMNVDGTPRMAEIRDQARMRGDAFYRAAAESALRAVLNPRCHPFTLPPEKYDSWKTMTLVFNPKEMFGT